MPEYFIKNQIGGEVTVKVSAVDQDKALELAAHLVIDDWEQAGSLQIVDVRQEVVPPTLDFDSSIYQNDEGSYAVAVDDPQYDPELDGEVD